MKFGFTVGCNGCTAINRGQQSQNHNEVCRKRIEELIKGEGSDDRVDRAEERKRKTAEEEN